MKYDHPEVIEPALDVIKGIDPELYATMKAADWDVHVITRIEPDDMKLDGPELETIQDNPSVEALTEPSGARNTDIVLPHMLGFREEYGASFPYAVAVNLVHEFAHHKGMDEVGGYAAGAKFASELDVQGKLLASQEQGLLMSLLGIL